MFPTRDIKNPYSVLIEDVVKLHLFALTERELKDAVEHFRGEIQSNRVMSYIKDIYSLVSILEARNVLNPQNVDALLVISNIVNRPLAARRIEDYKKHRKLSIQPPLPIQDSRDKLTDKDELTDKDKLTDKVFMEVAKLLGQDVYNFARALPFDFSESERQTLKIQSQGDFQEAALKILKLFRQRNPKIDHIQAIMSALNTIKRSNIRRKIEPIVSPDSRCS